MIVGDSVCRVCVSIQRMFKEKRSVRKVANRKISHVLTPSCTHAIQNDPLGRNPTQPPSFGLDRIRASVKALERGSHDRQHPLIFATASSHTSPTPGDSPLYHNDYLHL